jgi:hypothetical protein
MLSAVAVCGAGIADFGDLARFSHTASQREAGEGRGYEARAAWRAEAYLDSTLSTANKRNEVDAALSRLAADAVVESRLGASTDA